MSTGTAAKQNGTTAIAKPAETVITYVPLGETEPINLTISRVRLVCCTPTRSGALPSDAQILKFMLMCKAGGLNPFVNDAYLTGYDTKDGPQFSLITSIQAFLKRAEASPEFDGIEQGVIVLRDGQITERQGDFMLPGETLVGAWARVHRRDRRIPSYDAVNLKTFDQGRSRWLADPAGMIVKCAMASALRTAFPSTLAAMYCKEEMDRERERGTVQVVDNKPKTERLAERLLATVSTPSPQQIMDVVQPETVIEQQSDPVQSMSRLNDLSRMAQRSMSEDDLNEVMATAHDSVEDGTINPQDYEVIKSDVAAKRRELAK